MPYPLMREPAAPDADDDYQADLFPDEGISDWPDDESEISLAYVGPDGEEPVETDPDELEATMMNNLEAVASAFWVETGPDLAPRDETDDQPTVESWPGTAPALDPESENWDFRERNNDQLVGPRRGALLDFRPPRARRERPTRMKQEAPVKERRPARGGAFADDLAARNKEFYDLLQAPSPAPRKIAAAAADAPTVRPGFRSFFDADPRAPFVPQPAPARGGFRRHAVALGIVVVAIGAGAAVIAARSGGIAAPSSAVAATAEAEQEAVPPRIDATASVAPVATKDDSSRAPSEAVPKVVKTERVTASDNPLPAAPPVDPGTLATPPLYETAKAPTDSGATPSPLASLDLRPTDAATAPAAGETARAKTADVARAPLAEDPAIDETPPRATNSEPAKVDKPAPKKIASADPKPARAKSGGAVTSSAIVNQAVKMRSGPDNDASVVKVVPTGARVDIVACKGWCEVIAGGDRGYIFQRFLNRGAAPQALAPAPRAEVVKTSAQAEEHQPFDLLRLVNPGN